MRRLEASELRAGMRIRCATNWDYWRLKVGEIYTIEMVCLPGVGCQHPLATTHNRVKCNSVPGQYVLHLKEDIEANGYGGWYWDLKFELVEEMKWARELMP